MQSHGFQQNLSSIGTAAFPDNSLSDPRNEFTEANFLVIG